MIDPNAAPTPEDPKKAAAAELAGGAAVGGQAEVSEWTQKAGASVEYDALLDPNAPNPGETTIGNDPWAAVQTPNKMAVPGQTSERVDYWKPPTAEQIAAAAALGFDLTQQNKYYTKPADK